MPASSAQGYQTSAPPPASHEGMGVLTLSDYEEVEPASTWATNNPLMSPATTRPVALAFDHTDTGSVDFHADATIFGACAETASTAFDPNSSRASTVSPHWNSPTEAVTSATLSSGVTRTPPTFASQTTIGGRLNAARISLNSRGDTRSTVAPAAATYCGFDHRMRATFEEVTRAVTVSPVSSCTCSIHASSSSRASPPPSHGASRSPTVRLWEASRPKSASWMNPFSSMLTLPENRNSPRS